LFNIFDTSDWDNDSNSKTIRFTADKDCRLSFVDFVDSSKTKRDYKGPQLPITIMCAGNGTLSTPYTLNFLDDPIAKSLVYLQPDLFKLKLPPFFENLNTLLDKLCFFKFNR